MEKQKGYIVLEVGYEYNDEHYHTGNYGNTYDAPDKVFLDKEKATIELDNQTFAKLRGEDLERYNGNGLKGICKKGMVDEFCKVFKEEFGIDMDEDGYDIEIPESATNEQLAKVLDCLQLEFFKLVEVEIN